MIINDKYFISTDNILCTYYAITSIPLKFYAYSIDDGRLLVLTNKQFISGETNFFRFGSNGVDYHNIVLPYSNNTTGANIGSFDVYDADIYVATVSITQYHNKPLVELNNDTILVDASGGTVHNISLRSPIPLHYTYKGIINKEIEDDGIVFTDNDISVDITDNDTNDATLSINIINKNPNDFERVCYLQIGYGYNSYVGIDDFYVLILQKSDYIKDNSSGVDAELCSQYSTILFNGDYNSYNGGAIAKDIVRYYYNEMNNRIEVSKYILDDEYTNDPIYEVTYSNANLLPNKERLYNLPDYNTIVYLLSYDAIEYTMPVTIYGDVINITVTTETEDNCDFILPSCGGSSKIDIECNIPCMPKFNNDTGNYINSIIINNYTENPSIIVYNDTTYTYDEDIYNASLNISGSDGGRGNAVYKTFTYKLLYNTVQNIKIDRGVLFFGSTNGLTDTIYAYNTQIETGININSGSGWRYEVDGDMFFAINIETPNMYDTNINVECDINYSNKDRYSKVNIYFNDELIRQLTIIQYNEDPKIKFYYDEHSYITSGIASSINRTDYPHTSTYSILASSRPIWWSITPFNVEWAHISNYQSKVYNVWRDKGRTYCTVYVGENDGNERSTSTYINDYIGEEYELFVNQLGVDTGGTGGSGSTTGDTSGSGTTTGGTYTYYIDKNALTFPATRITVADVDNNTIGSATLPYLGIYCEVQGVSGYTTSGVGWSVEVIGESFYTINNNTPKYYYSNIYVGCDDNTTGAERTGSFKLYFDGVYVDTIQITQYEDNITVEVNPTTFNYDKDGGNGIVNISSSHPYWFGIGVNEISWLENKTINNNFTTTPSLTFTVPSNTEDTERSEDIYLNISTSKYVLINVNQSAVIIEQITPNDPLYEFYPPEHYVGYNGRYIRFNIISNYDMGWEMFSKSGDWASGEFIKNGKNTVYEVLVPVNTTTSDREISFTFKSTYNDVEYTAVGTIYQEAGETEPQFNSSYWSVPPMFMDGTNDINYYNADGESQSDDAVKVKRNIGINNHALCDVPYYDSDIRLCFKDSKDGPVDGADVLVFYDKPKYFKDDFGERYNVKLTDDIPEMLHLNEGKPCWLYRQSGIDDAFALTRYPSFGRYMTYKKNIINSINIGDPIKTFTLDYNFAEGNDIYGKRWDDFLSDQYSRDTRVLECYVKLPYKVMQYYLRNIFYFDESYWVLIEVKDYNITKETTTKCTFIKVNDPDNYI